MWDNFIGQQIRRCNRNLLIWNIAFLFAITTFASMFDYSEGGWSSLLITIPMLLIAGWNLSNWKKRVQDYTRHPICKRLASFGTLEQLIQEIETTILTNPEEKIAGVKVVGPWLFKSTVFGLTCFHVKDIVWVYQKVTSHSVNLIPTGKSFAALLLDRHGYSAEILAGKDKVEALMAHICQQSPWIVAGFSKDLEKMWKSKKAEFIAAVDERRKDFAKATAASAGR